MSFQYLVRSLCATVFLLHGVLPHNSTPPVGTLIAFAPTQDGLVVAADSRTTVARTFASGKKNIHCDDAVKISRVKNSHTVVAVANHDRLYFDFPAELPDPCKYLKTRPPAINFTAIATAFLDDYRDPTDESVVQRLQSLLIEKLIEARKSHPELIFDKETPYFLSVGIGNYKPELHISQVTTFGVCIVSVSARPKICDPQNLQFRANSAPLIPVIGEGDFVKTIVFGLKGRQILTDQSGRMREYDAYMNQRTVSEISHKTALLAAVDLIQSGALVCDQIGDKGIGGPTHAVLLDETHQLPFNLQ